MFKFFLIGLIGLVLGACSSSLSDSEIIMRTNSDKRKPKADYMPTEETSVENHSPGNKSLPIVPQVGIRIPLGK